MHEAERRAYWRTNLRLMAVLLAIWAFVSLGCSVLFVDVLNKVTFLNMPFGFWMGQQGSILTFVVIIGVYVWRMERLDDSYGFDETEQVQADHIHGGDAS